MAIKIGVLSDTHLGSVTELLRRTMETVFRDVDVLLHTGDFTSFEVYEYLSSWNLVAVRGNMDDYELRSMLPETRIEEMEGKRVGMMHGRGGPEGLEDLVFGEIGGVDLIVFGHSHIPVSVVREGTLLFNPGPFSPSRGRPGSVGLIEIDGAIRATHLKAG